MLWIIGFFVAFAVLSKFIQRKWGNPWKLYMIFGKKGSGKSSYLIKLAYRYQKRGFLVYTNMMDCVIPGVRLINIQHVGDFVPEEHSLLLLDEVGMIWDSRDFKNFKTPVRDFFKLQRHYKVVCYLASQTFDVDKKLRDLTDGMMLCTNLMTVFSLGRTITKRIVLTKATADGESRISENLAFEPIWRWHLTYIPRYAKGYDSYTAPPLPKLPYRENPEFPNTKENKKTRFKKDRSRRPRRKGKIQVAEKEGATVQIGEN